MGKFKDGKWLALLLPLASGCIADYDRVEISASTAAITAGGDDVQKESYAMLDETGKSILSNGLELKELSRIGSPLIDGQTVQATDVLIHENLVFATYNTKGEVYAGALQIFDVTDSENPVLLDEARFPQSDANRVRVQGEYVYVAGADETLSATLETFRFSDGELTHVSTLQLPGFQTTMLQINGEKGLATVGDNGGVVLLDLSDAGRPTISDFLPLKDTRFVEQLPEGDIIVLTGGFDARLLRYKLPEAIGAWDEPHAQAKVEGVTVGAPSWGNIIGNDLYISADVGGVAAFSIANGGIEAKQIIPTSGDANGLAATPDQRVAILANGQEGLVAIDALSAGEASALAHFDVPVDCGSANAVAVQHDLIAMADGLGGVKLFRYNVNKVPSRLTTILMTLSNPGVPRALAGQLAKQAINWTTPKVASRVIVVRDDFHNGEFAADTQFVVDLLEEQGYDVDYLEEPEAGITADHVAGYDAIWFSNPGWPLDDRASYDTLLEFSEQGGGVVLQGDDMSWTSTKDFSLSPLTYLNHVDNGTNFCGVNINNNNGGNYRVTFTEDDHPVSAGLNGQSFTYGDDIDHSEPLDQGEEVLAWATLDGDDGSCGKKSPVVVTYGPERAARLQGLDE